MKHLKDDVLLASKRADSTSVGGSKRPPLLAENDRLYGVLRAASTAIYHNGSLAAMAVCLLCGWVMSIGLHRHWFDVFLGETWSAHLRHWMVYGVIIVGALVVGGVMDEILERVIWKRWKPVVLHQLSQDNVDPYVLIAQIAEVEELARVLSWLERDFRTIEKIDKDTQRRGT